MFDEKQRENCRRQSFGRLPCFISFSIFMAQFFFAKISLVTKQTDLFFKMNFVWTFFSSILQIRLMTMVQYRCYRWWWWWWWPLPSLSKYNVCPSFKSHNDLNIGQIFLFENTQKKYSRNSFEKKWKYYNSINSNC